MANVHSPSKLHHGIKAAIVKYLYDVEPTHGAHWNEIDKRIAECFPQLRDKWLLTDTSEALTPLIHAVTSALATLTIEGKIRCKGSWQQLTAEQWLITTKQAGGAVDGYQAKPGADEPAGP
jgi:hypothetical protein